MPRRDGTGPVGNGPMMGRGLGYCFGANTVRDEAGLGMGLGFTRRCGFGHGYGRGHAANETCFKTKKELLQEQRDILQNWLETIDKQIESL